MKLGLVGCSVRGMFLVTLAMDEDKDNQLVAVADPSAENRERCADIFKTKGCSVATYESDRGLFDKETDLDAVIIGSGDCHHYGNLLVALEHSIPVYCEKPMVQRVEECDEIWRRWNENPITFCGGLEMRHSPLFGQVKEILDSGTIGVPFLVNAYEGVPGGGMHEHPIYRRKETGRTLLLQKGVHDLDLINWFINRPPRSVSALGGQNSFGPENRPDNHRFNPETAKSSFRAPYLNATVFESRKMDPYGDEVDMEDNYLVLIDYADNRRATFALAYNSAEYYHEFLVIGTKGKVTACFRHKANTAEIRIMTLGVPGEERVLRPGLHGGHGGGDALIMRDFLSAIREKRQPVAGMKAACLSSLVGAAAQDAIEKGEIIHLSDNISKGGIS